MSVISSRRAGLAVSCGRRIGGRALLVGFVALFVVACDSSVDQLDADSLSLSAPDRIRSARAVDLAAVTATATVNGVEVLLSPSGNGVFSGDVSAPPNTTVPISIQFSELIDGEQLVLATRTQQVNTGNSDEQVILRRSVYNFDAHDADGDSVSNIIEREENTDPFDATDAPALININVVVEQPAGIAIDNSGRYTVEASIGNSIRQLERSDNQFRGAFFTVDRAPVTVAAEFIEEVTGQKLSVASQSRELLSLFDQQTITFSNTEYQLPDRDGDRLADLAELVAGTSIFEATNAGGESAGGENAGGESEGGENTGGEGVMPADLIFTMMFDVPSIIQNPAAVYAEFQIDGQTVGLSRTSNTYVAESTVSADASVVLDVSVLDNFNGVEFVVAQAQMTVAITTNQQFVEFTESDFNLQIDTDADGVPNYIEREQATNPLVANTIPDNSGASVTCSVDEVPVQVISAGALASQPMGDLIDCGGAAFELAASGFQFSWNSADNIIQWVPPATAASGSQLSFTVDVRNPADTQEVYTSFQVVTMLAPSNSECNVTTSTSEFALIRDLHIQGTEVFNNGQLRVDSNDRRTLLAFALPSDATLTGNATLIVTVANDQGGGTIEVAQLDFFQWAETDEELLVPQTAVTLGSRTGSWLSGQQYQFNLGGLRQDNSGEVNLILTQVNGNDVAFLARESNTSSVLQVEITNDCGS